MDQEQALTPRALKPIVELGVDEAHALLIERFGQTGLPPLEAIENEDWGRDYLLSRFLQLSAEELAAADLCLEEADGEGQSSFS